MRDLEEILLIDGYNIINGWPILTESAMDDLDLARNQLINIMMDYQGYIGGKIIIVFDAYNSNELKEKIELYNDGKVEVVFTRKHETADHYIERYVTNVPKYQKVSVATSDGLEQTMVMARGAIRISARELLERVKLAQNEINKKYIEKPKVKSNTLRDLASPEVVAVLERLRRER